ncbi:hypothetical protein [Marinobacter fonticola]|uniref:hypothetical protein n=1 Tax=Marinobacter fonticola TaxID=2603215 RepID=UPI0011E7A18D|nr:hypothetical protein [Marinobacter fonticola]
MENNAELHQKINEVRERLFDAEILLMYMTDPSVLNADNPDVVLGALVKQAKEHVSFSAGEMTRIINPGEKNLV